MKNLAVRAFVLAVTGSTVASADVLRVDDSAAPGGDGSTWGRAFDSLTDALAAASSGDQVWVAEGTYAPDTPAGPGATFLVPAGVQVYGGFEGNENSLAARGNPLDPRVTLDGGGSVHHVVEMFGAGLSTILDGLVIIKGAAVGAAPDDRGAGIYAEDSAPTLRNIVFMDNHADTGGGALALVGASGGFATISDCQFADNTSDTKGGAVIAEVSATFERCVFDSNDADSAGAVRIEGGGVYTFVDCEFRENTASFGEGGAVVVATSAPSAAAIFDRCEFRSNSGSLSGGIAYLNDGEHTLRACRFLDNSALVSGSNAVRFGGVASSSLTLENCLVSGNDGAGNGVVSNEGDGTLRVVNTTIASNTITTNGGALFAFDGHTDVDNSIIFGNTSNNFGQNMNLWTGGAGTVAADRTIIQNLGIGQPAPPGVGNAPSDPKFVDADGPDNNSGTPDDNVRLMPGSIAIDRGNNLLLSPFASLDYYGDPRFRDDTGTPDTGVGDGVNDIVDLGCAEFQGTTPGGSCNPADLAEPFGTLDFSDVLAFLTGFAAMDPAVDYAPPFGTWDFSDVLAFLTDFGDGCP